MQKVFTTIVAIALTASIGCGKSEAEKQAEQAAADIQKAAEAAAKAAETASKGAAEGLKGAAEGMETFAKAMQGMAATMAESNGKTVAPISFRVLETALPKVSGWEMEKPRGETTSSPIAFSESKATYKKGDTEIDVQIIDSGFAQILIAPWSMFLTTGFSRETSEGYEKAVTVAGQPGYEKWQSDDKSGELNVLVNKRYLVTIEGNELADTKVLHDFMAKLDTSKLK